ncbi:hypothetical protein DMN91_002275 [Ooceraea biroi]|uniref:Secreted protein n=1 Tax=Ooceraea biroi TaxID=2015173 RepID=A0A3L8E059_OOCBI|nr:hypothetical protein DMN91_002275 [Ooceraea biroi]
MTRMTRQFLLLLLLQMLIVAKERKDAKRCKWNERSKEIPSALFPLRGWLNGFYRRRDTIAERRPEFHLIITSSSTYRAPPIRGI